MSLLVTLLGIALSAWLLPAITHQWNDRQKAQDLRAAVVADMASATAHALNGGEAIWSGNPVDRQHVLDEWAVASLEVETRLRAYFDEKLVRAWQAYNWLIVRFDDAHTGAAEAALEEASTPTIRLDASVADAIAVVFSVGNSASAHPPDFSTADGIEESGRGRLEAYVSTDSTVGFPLEPKLKASLAENALLRLEQAIAHEVLEAHPKGYSTTAHDFFHDLVP